MRNVCINESTSITVRNLCLDAVNQVCTSIIPSDFDDNFQRERMGTFDYKVNIVQNSITVLQGGDPVKATVDVSKIRGESKQVLLTVTSWRSQDISTRLSPTTVTPPATSSLRIETTCNTMPDQYLFTVRGETSGTFATSVDSVTLTVKKNKACYYPDIPNETVALSAFNKGFDLLEMGDNEKAVRYFDRAIDIFPEYTDALQYRGILLNELGKYDESIRSFDAAIESDPNNPTPYNNKGVTLKLQGKYSEALESLNQALEINPNYEIALEQKRIVENLISYELGGGCLIATAAYGSELAPQVQLLREIRNNSLLQTESGKSFMNTFNDFYYSFSPIIADYERENPVFKEAVKIAITPMISSLSLLNYVDMDSEVEVLGYGISLILLNVGMYFVLPAILIHGIKKYAENKCRN